MPLISRLNMIGAAIESAAGTSVFSSMDEGDTQFHVFNVSPVTEIDSEPRTLQGSFSRIPSVHGPRARQVTFSLHCYGNGSAGSPAWATTFLPACGLKYTSGTFSFAPTSVPTEHETLSIAVYEGGLIKKLRGCMGSVKWVFEYGKPLRADFTFRGVYDGSEDGANETGQTWPEIIPLRIGDTTFSLGGDVPVVSSLELDLQNQIELRPTIANSDAYVSALIVDRNYMGTMDPEEDLVANADYFANLIDHDQLALSIALGDTQYNKMLFEAPACQIMSVQEVVRSGFNALNVQFGLNADLGSGIDNELVITFPQTA